MKKILVVEDERSLRLLYEQELSKDGYAVETAATAQEGLALVDSSKPDLVVLDIRMPGMDGLDALSRILERHPKLKVVLNSAYSSYKDNFMSWAADAYVVKSSDLSELRNTVKSLLSEEHAGAGTAAPRRPPAK
jgi:DNA-binding response OmpR family regulator